MNILKYYNHEELANTMVDAVTKRGVTSCAVLFCDDAKKLFKWLLADKHTLIRNVELTEPDANGYTKEFYVSIDKDYYVTVEEAWHDDNIYHPQGYYRFDSCDIVLFHSDANSKVVNACEGSICFELEIENN